MRASQWLLATVEKSSKYLTAGNPTGLTGLYTHPTPRSTLIHLYSSTLVLLRQLPSSSAYRASTEALTKHRLSIVESTKPAGYDEWSAKAKKVIQENPNIFGDGAKGGSIVIQELDGKKFAQLRTSETEEGEGIEWDNEDLVAQSEGAGGAKELEQGRSKGPDTDSLASTVHWVPEPSLEADQYAYVVTERHVD